MIALADAGIILVCGISQDELDAKTLLKSTISVEDVYYLLRRESREKYIPAIGTLDEMLDDIEGGLKPA